MSWRNAMGLYDPWNDNDNDNGGLAQESADEEEES